MPNSIEKLYGNKVRARACGICVINDTLLMVNHHGLVDGDFWSPPGGGIEMNETAHETITREFKEETNLSVAVGDLLFVTEFRNDPLHAIELFFEVTVVDGSLKMGTDPEMDSHGQIINDVRFLTWAEISSMNPKHLHGIFKYSPQSWEITGLRGYFKL